MEFIASFSLAQAVKLSMVLWFSRMNLLPASAISEKAAINEAVYSSDPIDFLFCSIADGRATGRWLGASVSGGSFGQQGRADSAAVDA